MANDHLSARDWESLYSKGNTTDILASNANAQGFFEAITESDDDGLVLAQSILDYPASGFFFGFQETKKMLVKVTHHIFTPFRPAYRIDIETNLYGIQGLKDPTELVIFKPEIFAKTSSTFKTPCLVDFLDLDLSAEAVLSLPDRDSSMINVDDDDYDLPCNPTAVLTPRMATAIPPFLVSIIGRHDPWCLGDMLVACISTVMDFVSDFEEDAVARIYEGCFPIFQTIWILGQQDVEGCFMEGNLATSTNRAAMDKKRELELILAPPASAANQIANSSELTQILTNQQKLLAETQAQQEYPGVLSW